MGTRAALWIVFMDCRFVVIEILINQTDKPKVKPGIDWGTWY